MQRNPFDTQVESVIKQISRATARRYSDVTTFEDACQDCRLWVLEHQEKLQQWRDGGHPNWKGALGISLRRHLDKTYMEARASNGIEPLDEQETPMEPYKSFGDGPGTRKVMSNTAASTLTHNQYAGD